MRRGCDAPADGEPGLNNAGSKPPLELLPLELLEDELLLDDELLDELPVPLTVITKSRKLWHPLVLVYRAVYVALDVNVRVISRVVAL